MNRQSPESPQFPRLLQEAIQVSLQRQGQRILKRYHYPHAREREIALDRLSRWVDFSRDSPVVPRLEVGAVQLSSSGLTVEVIQERCRRLPHRTGTAMLPYLEQLQDALEQAWASGLVHGDLNRKNILLTASGYQLVDIEPLVCVPLASGSVYLRTTRPYLARADREKGSVTVMSDRLGWNCFSAWIREAIARPALAASQFEPQRQWSADCCTSR